MPTVKDLKRMCREQNKKGYSRLNKHELLEKCMDHPKTVRSLQAYLKHSGVVGYSKWRKAKLLQAYQQVIHRRGCPLIDGKKVARKKEKRPKKTTQNKGKKEEKVKKVTQNKGKKKEKMRKVTQDKGKKKENVKKVTQDKRKKKEKVKKVTQDKGKKNEKNMKKVEPIAQNKENNTDLLSCGGRTSERLMVAAMGMIFNYNVSFRGDHIPIGAHIMNALFEELGVDVELTPVLTVLYEGVESKHGLTYNLALSSSDTRLPRARKELEHFSSGRLGAEKAMKMTSDAQGMILEYTRDSKNLHHALAVPVSLNGEHMNMMYLMGDEAWYFEPLNEVTSFALDDGGVSLPYGEMRDFMRDEFQLEFFTQHCPAKTKQLMSDLEFQTVDTLCQSWSHWYLYIRASGFSHKDALWKMNRNHAGLLQFLRRGWESVDITRRNRRGKAMKTGPVCAHSALVSNINLQLQAEYSDNGMYMFGLRK